jgi:hypothetical protein
MENKYIIINRDTIQTRIEELENTIPLDRQEDSEIDRELSVLRKILSQSIPLIPKLEHAFNAGVISNSSDQYIIETKLSKQDCIDNFKLEI